MAPWWPWAMTPMVSAMFPVGNCGKSERTGPFGPVLFFAAMAAKLYEVFLGLEQNKTKGRFFFGTGF
jgi:hypothetical protein